MTEAQKIEEWKRWIAASSKTDPFYLPKALWAVYANDGEKMLHAVLKELKWDRTHKLIEAMSEPGTKSSSPANASDTHSA